MDIYVCLDYFLGIRSIWHPVMVCNPITGKFIKLPEPTSFMDVGVYNFGLGFCLETSRYKVIRMFAQKGDSKTNIDPVTNRPSSHYWIVEIHILGTNTWRNVGNAPHIPIEKCVYLNGTFNWLYVSYNHSTIPYYITSFDVGEERFQSIPIPPKSYHQFCYQYSNIIAVGELRGCLCVSDMTNNIESFELWVMKTFGVESSWKIEIKIDMSTVIRSWVRGPFIAMSYFIDGTLLFFNSWSSAVFSYAPSDRKIKILKLCERSTSVDGFEAIAYTPSFISLKDAITGADVEVYNVKSWWEDLELEGESDPVFLEEQTID